MSGQFGKNHVGDNNKYLPTVHGFDEFFGNLYHLNAEEEPEDPHYPKNPRFKELFGPRGVLKCKATDKDDPTDEKRWGASASRRSKTPGRSRRSAWKPSTRNSSAAPSTSSSARQGGQAVLLLVQHHAHARLDAPQACVAEQAGHSASCRRHGGARMARRAVARQARRPRHCRQHHRRVHDRQRRRGR